MTVTESKAPQTNDETSDGVARAEQLQQLLDVQQSEADEGRVPNEPVQNGAGADQEHWSHPSVQQVSEILLVGRPPWSRLARLVAEEVARLITGAIRRIIIRATDNTRSVEAANNSYPAGGRCSSASEKQLGALRAYILSGLPPAMMRDVLVICLANDKARCHHSPNECLALELWRVLFSHSFADVSIEHHEFAFPKTTNYPEIVQNLINLLGLVSEGIFSTGHPQLQQRQVDLVVPLNDDVSANSATLESFKLELKRCEVGGHLLQDNIAPCLVSLGHSLKVLELIGFGSDNLLHLMAEHCRNLETLSLRGSGDRITDEGFARFANRLQPESRAKLVRLDVSRCQLSHRSLETLQMFPRLSDLGLSPWLMMLPSSAGSSASSSSSSSTSSSSSSSSSASSHIDPYETQELRRLRFTGILCVSIEHDSSMAKGAFFGNASEASTTGAFCKEIRSLRRLFPCVKDVKLRNCVACELYVTLSQTPGGSSSRSNDVAFLARFLHTLDLVSPDNASSFPSSSSGGRRGSNSRRLNCPFPNLESLHIEKPNNLIFCVRDDDADGAGRSSGEDSLDEDSCDDDSYDEGQQLVVFENLKVLRLSRITLSNFPGFLARSRKLRRIKVTNVGKRERTRWTDDRVRALIPPDAVPNLEEIHLSCLPSEGGGAGPGTGQGAAAAASTSSSAPPRRTANKNLSYLQLTSATVQYFVDHFPKLRRISGVETWAPGGGLEPGSIQTLLRAHSSAGCSGQS